MKKTNLGNKYSWLAFLLTLLLFLNANFGWVNFQGNLFRASLIENEADNVIGESSEQIESVLKSGLTESVLENEFEKSVLNKEGEETVLEEVSAVSVQNDAAEIASEEEKIVEESVVIEASSSEQIESVLKSGLTESVLENEFEEPVLNKEGEETVLEEVSAVSVQNDEIEIASEEEEIAEESVVIEASSSEQIESVLESGSIESVSEREVEESVQIQEVEASALNKEVEASVEEASVESEEIEASSRQIVSDETEEIVPAQDEQNDAPIVVHSVLEMARYAGQDKFDVTVDEAGGVLTTTFQTDFVFETDNLKAELSRGMMLEAADKNAFNLMALNLEVAEDGTVQELVPGADTGFEFGIPGQHVIFSKPVKLTIPTDIENGKEVSMKVQHAGESITTKGLTTNPEATCTNGVSSDENNQVTVQNGTVEFYTCGASLFIVDDNTNNAEILNVVGQCTNDDYVYDVYWNADSGETNVDLLDESNTTLASNQTISPITITIPNNTSAAPFDIRLQETGNASNESNEVMVTRVNCSSTDLLNVPTPRKGFEDNDIPLNISVNPILTDGGAQLDIVATEVGFRDASAGATPTTFTVPASTAAIRITGYGGNDNGGVDDDEEDYQATSILVNVDDAIYSGKIFTVECQSAQCNDDYAFADIPLGSSSTSGTVFGDNGNNNNTITVDITGSTLSIVETQSISDQAYLVEYLASASTSSTFLGSGGDYLDAGVASSTIAMPANTNFVVASVIEGQGGLGSQHEDKAVGRVIVDFDTNLASGIMFAHKGRGGNDVASYGFTGYDITSGVSVLSSTATITGDSTANAINLPDLTISKSGNNITFTRPAAMAAAFRALINIESFERFNVGSNATDLGATFAFGNYIDNPNVENNFDFAFPGSAKNGTITLTTSNITGTSSTNENSGVAQVFVDFEKEETSGSFLMMRTTNPDLISWSNVPFGTRIIDHPNTVSNHASINNFGDELVGVLTFDKVTLPDNSTAFRVTANALSGDGSRNFLNYYVGMYGLWSGRLAATVSGIPTGGQFSHGAIDGDTGDLSVDPGELELLKFIPDEHFSGSGLITLEVDYESENHPLVLDIVRVADEPTLTTSNQTGMAGMPFDISGAFSYALVDQDGSEVISLVELSNIPVGDTVSDDGGNSFTATGGNQTVDITSWNQAALSYLSPGGVGKTITVRVQSEDDDGFSATTDTAEVTDVFDIDLTFGLMGKVWYDEDGNGDDNSGAESTGLQDVTLTLYDDDTGASPGNGVFDGDEAITNTTTTAVSTGMYAFSGMPAGNYLVVVDHTDSDLNNVAANGSRTYGTTTAKALAASVGAGNVTDQDFGFDEPEVQFATTSSSASETDGVQNLTVNQSISTGFVTTIPYSFNASSTASTGTDFTDGTALSVTIPAESTSTTIDITPTDDSLFENDETVTIDLNSPTGAASAATNQSHTLTITDSDNTAGSIDVDLSITQAGDENGTVSLIYTVTLANTNNTGSSITFDTSFTGGTATAGSDYTDVSGVGTMVILDGANTGFITVPVIDDADFESLAETVELTVSNVSDNAININTAMASGTITDDDGAVTAALSVTTQGDETGSQDVVYTVTLSKPNNTGSAVTFDTSFTGGSANPSTDITDVSGTATVSVANGSDTGTLVVPVTDDSLFENTEDLELTISNPSVASITITTDSSVTSITDNDNVAGSIDADLSVTTNGDESGPTDIVYTVTLSETNNTTGSIFFDTNVTGGTATLGDDYSNTTGTAMVSVPAGSNTGTFTIPVLDDALFENGEDIEITISNVSDPAININTAAATASIADNDNTAGSIVADISTTINGDEGIPTDIVYTVTLAQVNNTGSSITFDTSFSGGTATVGSDYTDVSGAATISVANGSDTGTITIPVTDDGDFEAASETVEMTISNASDAAIVINTATATATILDDENAAGLDADLSVSTNGDESGPQGIVYTVTLANANNTGSAITFDTSFTGGSAVVGSDYTDVSGVATLSVADGSSTGSITVPVIDDGDFENNEDVQLTIANPSEATININTSNALGTITDNDNAAGSIDADIAVTTSGDEDGPVDVVYTITLANTNNTASAITFDTSFTGGTATLGDDYTNSSGTATVSIAPGQNSGTLTVPVIDDSDFENGETVEVTIAGASDPAININTASATADIIDNDNTTGSVDADLSITINGAEDNANAPVSASLTVTLANDNNTGSPITFDVNLADVTATAGADYTDISGSGVLSVADGSGTATVIIPILEDTLFENNETFDAIISNASDAAININTASVTGVIINDDDNAGGSIDVNLSKTTDGDEEGPVDVVFTATLDVVNNTSGAINFDVAFSGTSTAGSDYVDNSGVGALSIPSGSASGTLTVSVIDDPTPEAPEDLTATISNSSDPAINIATASATAALADNDDPVPPAAPVIDPISTAAPVISGTAEPGTLVTLSLPSGVTCAEGNPVGVDLAGNFECTLVTDPGGTPTTLPEGTVVTAVATDIAGNVSGPAETTVYDDATTSQPPVINAVSDADLAITGTGVPGSTIDLSSSSPSIMCDNAPVIVDAMGNWSCDITSSGPLSTGNTVSATATEPGKAESPATNTPVTDDATTAPAPPVLDPTDGDPVTGTTIPNGVVNITDPVTGNVLCTTVADATGNFSCSPLVPPAVDGQELNATVTDPTTNSTSGPSSVIVDQTPPAAPTIDPITTTTNPVTGTGEPGSTIDISPLTCENAPVRVDASGNWECDTPSSLPLAAPSTVTVTATDPSGNTSDPTTTGIVDPNTTSLTPSIDPVDNDDTEITGTGVPGATIDLSSSSPSITCDNAPVIVDATGNWSCDITSSWPLSTGDTVSATATEPGLGTSPATTTPVSDSATSAPDSPEINPTDGSPISGTSGSGEVITVTDENGNVLCVTTADVSGNWSCDPSPMPNDGDTVYASATDPVTGSTSNPGSQVVDQTPPQAPTIDPVLHGDTEVTGTGEPGTTVFLEDPNNPGVGLCNNAPIVVDAAGNYSCTLITRAVEGNDVQATSTDAAGNESVPTQTEVIDPTTTSTPPQIDAVDSDDTEITGTGVPGATIDLSASSPSVTCDNAPVIVDAFGNWNCDITTSGPLSIGDTVSATATEPGKAESPATTTPVSDSATSAPDVPVIDPTDGSPISGTSGSGEVITVTDSDGNVLCITTADASGNWSCDPSPVPNNGETVYAAATDPVTGSTSNPGSQVIDQVPPQPPTIDPIATNTDPITGNGEPGSTIDISPLACDDAPVIVDASGNWECDISSNLPLPAPSTITATSTDPAGNTSDPVTTSITPPGATPTPSVDPTDGSQVTGTGVPGNTITITDTSGNVVCQTSVMPDGNYVCAPLSPKPSVGDVLDVIQTDPLTGPSQPATTTVVDSNQYVAPPSIDPSNGAVVTGQSDPGAIIEITDPVTGNILCTTVAESSGNYICDVSPDLVDGQAINVTATVGSIQSQPNFYTINLSDPDLDGVLTAQESFAQNNGDGNGDGILDLLQTQVTSVLNPIINKPVTMAVTGSNCQVIDGYDVVREAEQAVQDINHDYPIGLFDFELYCTNFGQSTEVTFYLDKVYDTTEWIWRKYNRNQETYAAYAENVVYSTALVGGETVTSVTLSITDNGLDDEDASLNARILDPSGPAFYGELIAGSAPTRHVVRMCDTSTGKCNEIYPTEGSLGYEAYRACYHDSQNSGIDCATAWAEGQGLLTVADFKAWEAGGLSQEEQFFSSAEKLKSGSCDSITYERFPERRGFGIAPNLFQDASYMDPGFSAVVDLAEQGVVSGDSDTGNARLYDPINRAEVTKIFTIAREDTLTLGDCVKRTNFPDVMTADWFHNFVQNLEYQDIVHGYDDGLFRPEKTINKAELMKIAAISFDFITEDQAKQTAQAQNLPWYQPYESAFDGKVVFPEWINVQEPSDEMTRSAAFTVLFEVLKEFDQPQAELTY